MSDPHRLSVELAAAPRRGGRPRAGDGARRDQRLRIRLSKNERGRIEILAQACALSVGTYLRLAALNRKIRPAVPAVNYDCLRELARLGNNLNQALVATYTRGASPELRPILLELLSLVRLLRSALVSRDGSEDAPR